MSAAVACDWAAERAAEHARLDEEDRCIATALAAAGLSMHGPMTTLRDVAAHLIMAYVARGDTVEALAHGGLVGGDRESWAQIGGWHVGDTWLSSTEYMFGDYAPNRYAWLLDDVRMLPTPIPCTGSLGLWTVPAQITARIEEQIGVRV